MTRECSVLSLQCKSASFESCIGGGAVLCRDAARWCRLEGDVAVVVLGLLGG